MCMKQGYKVQKKHRRLPLFEAWESRHVHICYPPKDLLNEVYEMAYRSVNQAETLFSLWIIMSDESGIHDSVNDDVRFVLESKHRSVCKVDEHFVKNIDMAF